MLSTFVPIKLVASIFALDGVIFAKELSIIYNKYIINI
jgi:hypothetical protein